MDQIGKTQDNESGNDYAATVMESMKKLILGWTESMLVYQTPAWESLPDIDLYMDQVITYMERQTGLFSKESEEKLLTPSMINNYVKNEVVPRPVQKKYSRQHMAYLLSVCMLKQILPIPDISRMINAQIESKEIADLYENFRKMQDETLHGIAASVKNELEESESKNITDKLYYLALKLSLEANARRIAATQILHTLEKSIAKINEEKLGQSDSETGEKLKSAQKRASKKDEK